MKYRLLKDCPHGKAGSVWEMVFQDCITPHNGERFHELELQGRSFRWKFPKSTFSDWFEEIKEMPKFTKEQEKELLSWYQSLSVSAGFGTNRPTHVADKLLQFHDWINKNTID